MLCHAHLRCDSRLRENLQSTHVLRGGLGQARLGPGNRSPESLRHKHPLPSLSHTDKDGFQEKHSPFGVPDGKEVMHLFNNSHACFASWVAFNALAHMAYFFLSLR